MNELIIIGIIIAICMLTLVFTMVVENYHSIIWWLSNKLHNIGEWWFDICTAYYKWRFDKQRKGRR